MVVAELEAVGSASIDVTEESKSVVVVVVVSFTVLMEVGKKKEDIA